MAEGAFELLRLAAEDVAADVALVELEGRLEGGVPEQVALRAGEAAVAPVPGSLQVDGDEVRASFAVPRSAAMGPLALEAGEIRVRLPEPDGARHDRMAALAREANALRRRTFEAEEAADTAREEAGDLRERIRNLEQTAAEIDRLRHRVTDLEDEKRLLRRQLQRARADLERLAREQARDELDAAERESGGDPDAARRRGLPLPERTAEHQAVAAAVAAAPAVEAPTVTADLEPLGPGDSVRVVSGRPSPRRRAGDPSAVPVADVGETSAPSLAVFVLLAVLGVVGFVLVVSAVL